MAPVDLLRVRVRYIGFLDGFRCAFKACWLHVWGMARTSCVGIFRRVLCYSPVRVSLNGFDVEPYHSIALTGSRVVRVLRT